MSNSELVLDALELLLEGDPSRPIKRSELRAATGLDEGSFTPVFQHLSAGSGAPAYAQRMHGILEQVPSMAAGWRRLTPKGRALMGLDGPTASTSLPLVDPKTVAEVLQSLDGARFDSFEFIRRFARDLPEEYRAIVAVYGEGGRGAGRHYSAYTHLAKSLSRYARIATPETGPELHFEEYVPAPAAFGNPVIAMWSCGASATAAPVESDVAGDLQELFSRRNLGPTQRRRLMNARLGQGDFRRDLLAFWGRRCALTGCADVRVLTASHIKRWVDSDDTERLDKYNGLLLTPNADRLFDRFLLTFDEAGGLVPSPRVSPNLLVTLGIDPAARLRLAPQHLPYLRWHQERLLR